MKARLPQGMGGGPQNMQSMLRAASCANASAFFAPSLHLSEKAIISAPLCLKYAGYYSDPSLF